MPCCGQGRATLAATPAVTLHVPPLAPPAPLPAAPATEAAAAPVLDSVRIRYTREPRVRVVGPASGRAYEFSGVAAVQSIDARDAEGLVNTGYFRRTY